MPVAFSGNRVSFISLTYLRPDPTDITKTLFNYPKTFDFSGIKVLYVRYNGKIVRVTSDAHSFIANTNIIKIKLQGYQSYSEPVIKMLVSPSGNDGLDFVDKTGSTGTVYVYRPFTIKNLSLYNRLCSVYVAGEDLTLGFLRDYPYVVTQVKYTNGMPNKSINLNIQGIDASKLVGFFNSVYMGPVYTNGAFSNNFTSEKAGRLEIVYKGLLEFATSMSGPWSNILGLSDIAPDTEAILYVRCGTSSLTQAQYFNAIKVFTTETV